MGLNTKWKLAFLAFFATLVLYFFFIVLPVEESIRNRQYQAETIRIEELR